MNNHNKAKNKVAFTTQQPWAPLLKDSRKNNNIHYKIPCSSYERLMSLIHEKISYIYKEKSNPANNKVDMRRVLSRWQPIINYLYTQGIIKKPQIYFEPTFNDEPKLYLLRLFSTSIKDITDGGIHVSGYSRGVSLDLDEAISKVIGELLERYPLTIYRNKNLVRASISDLKKNKKHFLNPYLVPQFSEDQKKKFPNRNFTEENIFRWVQGASLTTGKHALMPAQMVFWNYRFAEDEPFLQQPITNGAGGMFTKEGAILSGLYELVQRDSFFVFWLNKISPPQIDITSLSNKNTKKLLGDLDRYNIKAHILDTTSDLRIPSYVCVLVDSSQIGTAISLGGGCGLDPEHAILRAITEAIGVRHWIRLKAEENDNTYPEFPDEHYEPFSSPIGQLLRLLYWGNHSMKKNIDFFLNGETVTLNSRYPFYCNADGNDELACILKIFKNLGPAYEVFCFEAHHLILKKLGYFSVQICIPALFPLYMKEFSAPLGAQRIKDACEKLGYTPSTRINPIPHPFP